MCLDVVPFSSTRISSKVCISFESRNVLNLLKFLNYSRYIQKSDRLNRLPPVCWPTIAKRIHSEAVKRGEHVPPPTQFSEVRNSCPASPVGRQSLLRTSRKRSGSKLHLEQRNLSDMFYYNAVSAIDHRLSCCLHFSDHCSSTKKQDPSTCSDPRSSIYYCICFFYVSPPLFSYLEVNPISY